MYDVLSALYLITPNEWPILQNIDSEITEATEFLAISPVYGHGLISPHAVLHTENGTFIYGNSLDFGLGELCVDIFV